MLTRSESYKKGMILSTIFNVFAKGLSFCTNIFIAYYFGTSASTDLYFYMMGLIVTISMFVNGSTSSVIIPEAINIKLKEGVQCAHKFLNFFLFLFGLITLIPSSVLLFSPVFALKTFSKFTEPVLNSNIEMIMLFSILLIVITINNFLKEVMGIFLYFTAPMIISFINSICCLIFIFFFHSKLSVISIAVGLIFGNVINLALLLYFLKSKTGWNYHCTIISRKHLRNILYSQSGYLATMLSNLIPPYLLSGIGAGFISVLNYSRQITEIPTSFITAQIASVSGIRFNTLYAANERSQLNYAFIKTFSFLVFILMPVCGIIFIFSKEIVTVVFSRGAFSHTSIEGTSIFCKYFILTVPLIALDQLSTRILIAAKKIPETFWYQIGSNLFIVASVIVLFPYLQAIAFPVVLLINYILNVFIQPIFFHYLCPFIAYNVILWRFFFIAFVNSAVATAVYFGFAYWANSYLPPLVLIIMGTAFYIILIVLINFVFKINEDVNALTKKTLSIFLKAN